MDRTASIAERAPWRDFPSVLRNGDLNSLSSEPEYTLAKGGDEIAAIRMVYRLVTNALVNEVTAIAQERRPVLVPVLALEATGANQIPLALAHVLADRTGFSIAEDIVQIVRAHRTGSGADHRLAHNPVFDGDVHPGQPYLILDDTLAMGGTLASLRGFIENRGGNVVGAAVMTAHPGAVNLPVKQGMLDAIHLKHPGMDEYWRHEFGFGIDQLTQGEAGHLKAASSLQAMQERISAARQAVNGSPGPGPLPSEMVRNAVEQIQTAPTTKKGPSLG